MWSPGQSHGRFYGLPPQDAHGVLEAPIDVADGGREDFFMNLPTMDVDGKDLCRLSFSCVLEHFEGQGIYIIYYIPHV